MPRVINNLIAGLENVSSYPNIVTNAAGVSVFDNTSNSDTIKSITDLFNHVLLNESMVNQSVLDLTAKSVTNWKPTLTLAQFKTVINSGGVAVGDVRVISETKDAYLRVGNGTGENLSTILSDLGSDFIRYLDSVEINQNIASGIAAGIAAAANQQAIPAVPGSNAVPATATSPAIPAVLAVPAVPAGGIITAINNATAPAVAGVTAAPATATTPAVVGVTAVPAGVIAAAIDNAAKIKVAFINLNSPTGTPNATLPSSTTNPPGATTATALTTLFGNVFLTSVDVLCVSLRSPGGQYTDKYATFTIPGNNKLNSFIFIRNPEGTGTAGSVWLVN